MKEKTRKFRNSEFGDLRVIEEYGDVWFAAVDVLPSLKYGYGLRYYYDYVKPKDRAKIAVKGRKKLCFITMNGLETLMNNSSLDNDAKSGYMSWVKNDILPQLAENKPDNITIDNGSKTQESTGNVLIWGQSQKISSVNDIFAFLKDASKGNIPQCEESKAGTDKDDSQDTRDELTLLEDDLVPVYTTDSGEKVVYGRELWEVLQVKTKFADWVKKRFSECDAVENEDYTRLLKKKKANNATKIEYIIKLDVAKEMAMLERNDQGKKVRRYFIEVEKRHKANLSSTHEKTSNHVYEQQQSESELFQQMIVKTMEIMGGTIENICNNLVHCNEKISQVEQQSLETNKRIDDCENKIDGYNDAIRNINDRLDNLENPSNQEEPEEYEDTSYLDNMKKFRQRKWRESKLPEDVKNKIREVKQKKIDRWVTNKDIRILFERHFKTDLRKQYCKKFNVEYFYDIDEGQVDEAMAFIENWKPDAEYMKWAFRTVTKDYECGFRNKYYYPEEREECIAAYERLFPNELVKRLEIEGM